MKELLLFPQRGLFSRFMMVISQFFLKKVTDKSLLPCRHHHTYSKVGGIDWSILLESDYLVNAYGYTGRFITDEMFLGWKNLKILEIINWDTSNVTSMSSMFNDCLSLTSLDVSSFDTSKVTYMNSMFSNCSSLTSLDLSSFDTSNVTSMGIMFSNCSSLTSLDLSNFNTSNVTAMDYMFNPCNKLTDVTWGNNWLPNTQITSFDISSSPISHDSCLDLFNKLATRDNSPTLKLSTTTKGYMSEEEIAIATNKGWTVA
mgnify:CR=1